MRLEVVPDALRDAAGDVEWMRRAVESLAVARHLDAAAAAAAGGLLAGAAAGVADGWGRERARVTAELARYARALGQSAAAYTAADAAAAGRVGAS
jgi:hypothetical protein